MYSIINSVALEIEVPRGKKLNSSSRPSQVYKKCVLGKKN